MICYWLLILNGFPFSNGSIKVHFRVVVQSVKDKEPSEVEKKVGETLKSVKDDQLGRLKVKSIELRGLFRVSIKSRRFI